MLECIIDGCDFTCEDGPAEGNLAGGAFAKLYRHGHDAHRMELVELLYESGDVELAYQVTVPGINNDFEMPDFGDEPLACGIENPDYCDACQ